MSKNRKIDMVILGLLAHENLTGYDIKKRIDSGISFFWKGSYGSIYPSLSAMEQEGLVRKAADDSGKQGREKIRYQITDAGREALILWLQESKATNDLKYETLLKIFFGGVADTAVTLATIEEFERETKEALRILSMYKTNLKRVLDNKDHVFYYLTVTFGIETYESYLRWCEEAKELLKRYE